MLRSRFTRAGNTLGALSMVLAFTACGGGGSSSSGSPVVVAPSPSPSASPTTSPTPIASCSLSARQDWARSVLEEWYLFPDLLDTSVNKAAYASVQDYVDALVAPARAQSKDRGFTYLTSIAEEDAYYAQGSTAGFGIRLGYDSVNNRLYAVEVYESSPAYAAGIGRGDRITGIGVPGSPAVIVETATIDEIVTALGPDDVGVSRELTFIKPAGGTHTATVTKADFDLAPLSPAYGAKIIDHAGRKIGYVNLRSFIIPAEDQLRSAFAMFAGAGVTEVVIDVRYNGGGLIRTAQVLSELMNKGREGQLFSTLELRPSKASQNESYAFGPSSSAIAATKIAFIGTGSSASASELIMNAQIPYSGSNTALIGTNTYGKPVGQYGFDRPVCDDRLRAVTFRTVNAAGDGDYYTGMASVMPATCRADDDIFTSLGDPQEASLRTALDWLDGKTCTAIGGTGQTTSAASGKRPLMSARPSTAQIEQPGLF